MKVLIIGYVWPEPKSSAAGLRDRNLIDAFKKAHWDVNFASPSKENIHSAALHSEGIPTFVIHANDPHFDEWIVNLNPDCVIFDRFVIEEQFGWRVQENCPHALRILDTQDLHSLRRKRQALLTQSVDFEKITSGDFDLIHEDTLRELGSIYRCDSSLILSDYEIRLLTERLGIPAELLFLSRFHYPQPVPQRGYADRKNFMMIGNFRHPPNLDGVFWFQKEIWPLIRQTLKNAEVSIYGAYPPREVMQLHNPKEGFHVKGFIEDQFEVLGQHRVNLAPLRFGAGIKGKISDGWWSGVPVVTTSLGAEGMVENLPFGGKIANTASHFAEKAIELYTDPICWSIAQGNGFNLIDKIYSEKENSEKLITHLKFLKKNLNEFRKKNIVGLMLHHHLHKSTKYFSRWIELKNSKAPENAPATPKPFSGASTKMLLQ